MAILVTGASGFLGSRLAEKLHELGHVVVTFGRSPTLPPRLSRLSIKHIQGSIEDFSSVTQAVSNCQVVYHMAGLVSYRRCDYKKLYATNVLGTRNIMTACLQTGVERVIHMSSIAGMGIPEPEQIGDEKIEYNLRGHGLYYCDTKYESEQEVYKLVKQGLPAIILNPGITFGEGDSHPHHHTIFRAIANGWFLGYPSGGVMFSYLEDVVQVCINALTLGQLGSRYVVGNVNLSYKEAASILARVLQAKKPVFPIPGSLSEAAGLLCETIFPLFGKIPKLTWQAAWLSQQKIFFSCAKASKELGFKPTSFEEIIARTAPYYLGSGLAGTKL